MTKYRTTHQDSTEQEDESAAPVMHQVAAIASEYNSEYVGFNVASSQDEDPSIVIDKRRNLRSG